MLVSNHTLAIANHNLVFCHRVSSIIYILVILPQPSHILLDVVVSGAAEAGIQVSGSARGVEAQGPGSVPRSDWLRRRSWLGPDRSE